MIRATRWLISSLILAVAAAETATQSYDYIVVGAGTCGLAVANRLSEDPNVSVVVIDPGNDERSNPNVTIPEIWPNNYGSSIDWSYTSVPQPGAYGKLFPYHAGKGIGGTSLINGMTYIRADKAQIDAWEKLGNPGWNWDALLPYYKIVERFYPPIESQVAAGASYDPAYHGTSGPLRVGFIPPLEEGPFEPTVAEGWESLSFPVNKDVNSGTTYGFDVWPMTLDPVLNYRWDAATAFYWPVQNRTNLKLIKGTARKTVWDSSSHSDRLPRVAGVEYIDSSGKSHTITAKREVIVSAGSLRTPLFLELSGIGNPNILHKHGIEVKIDLPAVGENLQDQPNLVLSSSTDFNVTGYAPYDTFATALDLFGGNTSTVAAATRASLKSWAQTVADGSNGGVNASALEILYKIQHDLIFKKNVTLTEVITTASGEDLLTVYVNLLPFSRGSVHITDPAKINDPAIDPKFYLIEHDLDVSIAEGRLCQRFFETESIKSHITGDSPPPGPGVPANATDAQWANFTRSTLGSNYHPLATAAMMARELGGVVDPKLRVYGVQNLRVVDASVLPTQFSGHLTATLYAVAQRASEFIKATA